MAPIFNDLKIQFKQGNIVKRLLFINIAVFLLCVIVGVVMQLFNYSSASFLSFFELPASFVKWLRQPWSLFTYMFMHADILHILFNMLWLYWFGQLFLLVFSQKHLRGLYILGGICGGLLYMISYNLFPYFRPVVEGSYLLGASASVLAIVVAAAYREPDHVIRLLFFGNVRLKYLALVVVVTDLLFLTSANAGGHISHLGGALGGLWFASALAKGRDMTSWINRVLDALSGKGFGKKRKPKMKVHYNRNPKDFEYNARKKADTEEVDRILDKIRKSGYQNLTADEKQKLFDASKR
ncbi:MAG: rhomboid family intramembrane serine protease [Bacteroides sp.]|nr:rhomboid family intramembrane serine protease [Bacteroides sp.]